MFMKDPIDRSEKLTEEISFQASFKNLRSDDTFLFHSTPSWPFP